MKKSTKNPASEPNQEQGIRIGSWGNDDITTTDRVAVLKVGDGLMGAEDVIAHYHQEQELGGSNEIIFLGETGTLWLRMMENAWEQNNRKAGLDVLGVARSIRAKLTGLGIYEDGMTDWEKGQVVEIKRVNQILIDGIVDRLKL